MIRSFLLNFLWAYLITGLCRAVFVAENWGLLAPQLTAEPWGRLFTGSLLFDTSALLYLMAPYALAALLPLPAEWKARRGYNLVLRLFFMLAMVLFAGVRGRMESCDVPESFKGLPITLIAASIVSLSFFGFAGVVDRLFA